MGKQLEEIEITYVKDKIVRDNWCVAEIIHETERTTGIFIKERGHPLPNHAYRCWGTWDTYTNKFGNTSYQFKVKTFVECEPVGRAGVIAYLQKLKGIGPAKAGKLWSKFGGDAIRVLRETPEAASAACPGLTLEVADKASEGLKFKKSTEGVMVELMDLLDRRGFPKNLPELLIKEMGNKAPRIVKEDPYALLPFSGCGFKLCDALYLDLGHDPAALRRQALCAWYALESERSGHTWHRVKVIHDALRQTISGTHPQTDKAIEVAVRDKLIALIQSLGDKGPPHWDGDVLWAATATDHRNELEIAERVAQANREATQWPDIDDIVVSDHQREQLGKALRGPIGIFIGSPGTGKTHCAAQLIHKLIKHYGVHNIAAAAPTGKAAVRMTEAMREHQVPLTAKTWHSLLGVQDVGIGGWTFAHHAGNPLDQAVLIADEMSMCDTSLAKHILAARAKGTLLLLIGDINQLPPVGVGAPLRDLIAAGLPCGELTEIHRNEGGIVQACADIRDGKQFKCDGNLMHVDASSPGQQKAYLPNVLEIAAEKHGIDPVWDIQVITALNKSGQVSRNELNTLLQRQLNSNPEIEKSPFRLHDKVINTKNNWLNHVGPAAEGVTINDEKQVYVANGEFGKVIRAEPKFLHVSLTSPVRVVVVPRGTPKKDSEQGAALCDWELGYAVSCHKMQGSQAPVVLVLLDSSKGAMQLCSREWLFTAISRAERECYLIGKQATALAYARRTVIDQRKTFLRERLLEQMEYATVPVCSSD